MDSTATLSTGQSLPPAIRDRIVGLRRVKASELRKNEKNWRLHPEQQKSSLRAILSEIGLVDAVMAREAADGSLVLIDGHLRQEIMGDDIVPVIVVDLTEQEADKVLATFDPLGDLAKIDDDALRGLLGSIDVDDNADLRNTLSALHSKLAKEQETEPVKNEVPGMALQPHEHYDYLVVLATTTHEWNVLCDKLQLIPEKRKNRVGTSRAIRAGQLLAALGVSSVAPPEAAGDKDA